MQMPNPSNSRPSRNLGPRSLQWSRSMRRCSTPNCAASCSLTQNPFLAKNGMDCEALADTADTGAEQSSMRASSGLPELVPVKSAGQNSFKQQNGC